MKNLLLACLVIVLGLVTYSFVPSTSIDSSQLEKSSSESTNDLPNIVFILIDDLGISTTPTYANKDGEDKGWVSSNPNGQNAVQFSTPNLHQFGKEAKIFTNMYATALCAPSRSQLITGRYPFRTGMVYPAWSDVNTPAPYYQNNFTTNATYPTRALGPMDTRQVGYPEVLRAKGYTTIFGGKWNLRYGLSMASVDGRNSGSTSTFPTYVNNQSDHLNAMGFDNTFGPVSVIGHTIDYYPPQLENNTPIDNQYLPNNVSQWLGTALENCYQNNERFYLHYTLGLIHDPASGNASQEHGFAPPPSHAGATQRESVFAYKMEETDRLIGLMVDRIDQLDAQNGTNTMIIIAGDNGTEPQYYSKYQDIWVQGGKGTTETHGSRVPFMVRWKNIAAANHRDATLADFSDIFPTMLELVNGRSSLDSLIAIGNPGYRSCFSLNNSNRTDDSNSCYLLDGRSLLKGITGGQKGNDYPTRLGIYQQFTANAFVANSTYQTTFLARESGFYQINDSTLEDILLAEISSSGIGTPLAPNPFDSRTQHDEYFGYLALSNFYNNLFPFADN